MVKHNIKKKTVSTSEKKTTYIKKGWDIKTK